MKISPTQSPPPNYLAFAILSTIFCCQVFGIVSIVYAAQVNSKWYAGDYEGAMRASRNAKTWAWVSVLSVFIIVGLYFLLMAFGLFTALSLDALQV